MRVLVVGGGLAGATAALEAYRLGHAVTLVTKTRLMDSATRWAQGGIAAVLDPADTVAAHVADTLRAADGLADAEAVEVLCTEGPARVEELRRLGVPFDLDPATGSLALAREAAHSARRIVHAGGDATGLALASTLARAVERSGIEVLEDATLVRLRADPRSGRVQGAEFATPERRIVRDADAVVLATGGAGQLYRHTTNPSIATGDGIAVAVRSGAEVRGLEFVQFHPTALAVPGTPLVSEAVRGEGAVLLDEQGRRFMFDEHPDGELAPRDVVARGIARAMARQGGRPVLLDATGIAGLAERFPTITASVRAAGLDWTREPVPVTPAAHYLMGGIRTDLDGRTSVPGLFAVGECASTGVHGANRLASNSLLEGLVFGHRVAHALAEPTPVGSWPAAQSAASTSPTAPVTGTVTAASTACPPALGAVIRRRVQTLMWDRVGVFRDTDGLAAAIAELDALAAEIGTDPSPADDTAALETRNLVLLAGLVARAARDRVESAGAHFRLDARRVSRDDAPRPVEAPRAPAGRVPDPAPLRGRRAARLEKA